MSKKKKSRPGPAARKKAKAKGKKKSAAKPLQKWSMMPPPRRPPIEEEFMDVDEELLSLLSPEDLEEAEEFADMLGLWTEEDVEAMSTLEILQHLGELGIPLTEQQALKDILTWDPLNPQRLGIMWEERAGAEEPTDKEADFCWMAGLILWGRLAPDRPNVLHVEHQVERGWTIPNMRPEPFEKALPPWREAWRQFRTMLRPAWKTLDAMLNDVDKEGDRNYDFDKWLQQMLVAYQEAVGQDPARWGEEAESFAKEFLEAFPKAGKEWEDLAKQLQAG